MGLTLYNGSLLLKNGALGTGQGCCCGGACCLPERCTLELDVDFTGTEYEGGPFPTPAGWVQMGALVPEFPNVIHYIYVIPDTEPCDDQSQYYADLVAAIYAWSDDLSLPTGAIAFSSVSLQTASCQDGLTQSACESQGGTYHAGQTCAEEPCVNPCTCGITANVNWFMPDNGAAARVFCTAEERVPAYLEDIAAAEAKAQELADILSANGWECVGSNGTAMADMASYGDPNWPIECDGYGPGDFTYITYPEFALALGRCCGTVDYTAAPLDFGGVAYAETYDLSTPPGLFGAVYPCIANPLP